MVRTKLGGANTQTAFIQFSESLLKHTAGLKRLDAAVPVLVMLAQYTAAAAGDYKEFNGSDAAKSLQDKLDYLLKTLQDDLSNIISVENQRVNDFNDFIVKVDANINALEKSIADLKQQITDMSACVLREGLIVSEATNKKSRNNDLAQKASDMCLKFAEEVAAAQKSREIEIGVIKEILTLLEIRFKTVPQKMLDYMVTIEAQFAEYANRTKFIVYTIYQRAALIEDLKGKDIVGDTKNYVENVKF